MEMSRRHALAVAAAAALLPAAAFAQSFPNRPIRFVVPFPPGGSLDVSARAVADRMTVLLSRTGPVPAAMSAPISWRSPHRTATRW